MTGIEPATSSLQVRRTAYCATSANRSMWESNPPGVLLARQVSTPCRPIPQMRRSLELRGYNRRIPDQ